MPAASRGVFNGVVFELELPRDGKKHVHDTISNNGGKFSFTISRKVIINTQHFTCTLLLHNIVC